MIIEKRDKHFEERLMKYDLVGPKYEQGRMQPKVERGAICRVGAKNQGAPSALPAKNIVKSKRAKGAKKFLGLSSGKILCFFQLNNALIYMFATFRTKHEKRGHLGQVKGRPSC